jgi:Kef-type K+ transport system membrane component KefB
MSLISSLFLLLCGAHFLGALCTRVGLPALAGHMIAGAIIGPSVLGFVTPDSSLGAVSDIAVLIVVLTAGLEMRLQHVIDVLRDGTGSLLVGFFLPLVGGGAIALAFGVPPLPSLVVALCVAVTALPIALQILRSFQMLGTQIARVAVAGALLADTIVFIALGALISVAGGTTEQTWGTAAALAIGKLLGLVAAIALAHWLCGRVAQLRRSREGTDPVLSMAGALSFALLFVLCLGAVSELLGFHFAIGAFFAAMMLTSELIGAHAFERLEQTCEVLTASLFGPLFLAFQGMQFHLQSLTHPGFVVVLVAGAIVLKLVSGYIVGRMLRMSRHDAWGVGTIMNAHGVMELVVASIALKAGLIDAEVFSALLIVGLVTTMATPLMLKSWQNRAPVPAAASQSSRAR